ncbi:hypothetical protein BH11GEM2_BH11GEM2_41250 [soil metagenome]|jgi:hypothetical protein
MGQIPRAFCLGFAATVLTASCASSAGAQRFFRPAPQPIEEHNIPYDGRFIFARLKYTTGPGGYYYGGQPAWSHGFPKAETNLMRIIGAVTEVKLHQDASNALALDDPQLMKFPVAFMTEAGYWTMTDKEAAGLRNYFTKGGFVIFDDFRDGRGNAGWANFELQMKRVLPNARMVDLQPTHPIFHSFFEINSFSIIPQKYDGGAPILRAIYEDNDPKKRMLAMINFNTDVSDFWEFSGTGMSIVAEDNEAYKLGVNYILYALTH